MLDLIWQGSIVLSAASVVLLIALFFRRLLIQAFEAKLDKRRAEINAKVIAYITADEMPAWTHPVKSVVDQRILLGIASNLLQSVSGALRTRILALLNTVVNVEHMLDLLKNGKPGDRAKVAARLFWSHDPQVHEALLTALCDPNPDVVLAAANSLVALGRHIDLAQLMPILKARGMIDHRGTRDLLRNVARANTPAMAAMIEGPDSDLAVLALDAIGRSMDVALVAAVKAATTHADDDVRAAAVRALGNAAEPMAGDVIRQALDDKAWEVQVQAAIAAGRLKLTSLTPRLALCLESEHWWLRWRAAQALARLGPIGQQILRAVPLDSPAAGLIDAAMAEVHGP